MRWHKISMTLFCKRSPEATNDWGWCTVTFQSSNSRACWFLKKSAQEVVQQQKIVLRNSRHDRECDYWHHPHCKYFKKDNRDMGKYCSFVHPQKTKRSTSPRRKERGKAKKSDKRKGTVATVNVANHCPGNTSGKLPQKKKTWSTSPRRKERGKAEK